MRQIPISPINWKIIATAFAFILWSVITAICGWNLHETIVLGKEVVRIEQKLDMTPLSKSDKSFDENRDLAKQ